MDDSEDDRFYLNTARPAPCNGTIKQFGYCYYGCDDIDDDENTMSYKVLVSIYRLVDGNDYTNIGNSTVPIIKQTPISQVSPADALLPGFNCDSVELEESVPVLEGDVIGVCLANNNDLFNRLDVVSRTESDDNDGYSIRYTNANNCENLPMSIVDNALEFQDNRILHIFAEICELIPIY